MPTFLHKKKSIDAARRQASEWLSADKKRRGEFFAWWRKNYSNDENENTMKSRLLRMAGLAPYYIIGSGCGEWQAAGLDKCLIDFYETYEGCGIPAPLYSPSHYFSTLRQTRGYLRLLYTFMNDRDLGWQGVNELFSSDHILTHTERVGICGLITEFVGATAKITEA